MKTSNKQKAYLVFLVLFVFAAIRYGVGYDYYSYRRLIFHEIEDEVRIEPLSKFLMEIGYYTHYQLFFVISSFLTLFPVYKICSKYSVNPAMSLMIFYLHPSFYLNFFSIVRNSIAISLAFVAFFYMLEKKWIRSFLSLGVACLFHISVAIGVLMYIVYFLKNTRFIHVVAYCLSFAVTVILTSLISQYADSIALVNMAQHYVNKAGEGGATLTIVINFLALLNLINWNNISRMGKYNQYYLAMCNIGVCLWNVFRTVDITMADRFSLVFLVPIILVIPCYALLVNRKNQRFIKIVTFSFFMVLFTSYFYISVSGFLKTPERMSNVPYQTVFWNTDYSNLQ